MTSRYFGRATLGLYSHPLAWITFKFIDIKESCGCKQSNQVRFRP